MTAAAPYRVLVVCTGNICRSPYAERLLRQAFAELGSDWADGVEVTSAGLVPLVGAVMDPPMAELLRERGVDPAGHVARAVDRELVAAADLVLTATREHRREVVRLLPRASRSIFTLPEFTRLLEDAATVGALGALAPAPPAELLRAATAAAADRRGFAEAPENAASDDVDDPYRRAPEVYAAAATRLGELTARIAVVLERLVDRPAVGSGR